MKTSNREGIFEFYEKTIIVAQDIQKMIFMLPKAAKQPVLIVEHLNTYGKTAVSVLSY